ncbi:hypothetical protein O3M35_013122 [Rhynocoris fuscipes]|uniref:Uncharacterized protein n=1 Tax=Rhynocoris fuscipes TaxID=488301 RepID=A0AAW1CER9_9HEMI
MLCKRVCSVCDASVRYRSIDPLVTSDTNSFINEVITTAPKVIHLYGLRIESAEKSWSTAEDGIPLLLQGSGATVRLFGSGFTRDIAFVLTRMPGKAGQHCEYPVSETHQVTDF